MRLNPRRFYLLLVAALPLALYGCAGNDEEEYSEVRNITEAYEDARRSIERGNYRRGIQVF